MKMVLALRHQQLPRTLHADAPSPHIDWSAGDVRLLTEATAWPAAGRPRRAGVSSFGLSGTNAHVIIEEAPASPAGAASPTDPDATGAHPSSPADGDHAPVLLPGQAAAWLVSGKTAAGLAGQAARLAEWAVARPGLNAADVARSLATTRSAFAHRAVITAATRDDLIAGLRSVAAGAPAGSGAVRLAASPVIGPPAAGALGAVTGALTGDGTGRVGFLFSGQGSQRAGMASGLHRASPVFAAAFDAAAGLLEELLGVPVAEVALGRAEDDADVHDADVHDGGGHDAGGHGDERADQTLYAQPCLFAVQAGLIALLSACGIAPDAVAGHSVGEVAAAYAAGVLSLEDACRLVAARARGMQALPEGGAMCAIAAPEAEVAAVLADAGLRAGVSIAAVNGPAAVVISGDEQPVRRLAEAFAAGGTRTRMLRVSHAFHSARMDPMLAGLDQDAAALPHAAPRIAWAGALDGNLVTSADPAYWAAAARRPVRFADAVRTLAAAGVGVFIEIGPDGTLSALGPAAVEAPVVGGPVVKGPVAEGPVSAKRSEGPELDGAELDGAEADGEGARAVFVPVQRPGSPAADVLLTALARLHVTGVPVDWAAVLPAGPPVELPTYAFQRQRFWARAAHAPVIGARVTGAAAVAGGDGASAVAEARFWAAVEDGDLEAVAGALAVDARLPLGQALPALASWRRHQRAESTVAGWRYRIGWTPAPDPGAVALSGTWLLVAAEGDGAAAWCAAALAARGARVAAVTIDPAAASREALAAALNAHQDQAAAGRQPLAGVLSLLALDERPLDGYSAVPAGVAATLALVQALGDAGIGAPLWVVTSGAVAAVPGEPLPSPVQAQAWGLGRVAGLEHPDRWGGLIDLPASASLPAYDERTAARLCAVLAGCGEDQVALRPTGILGRRLTRASFSRAGRTWGPAGQVLVTGGTGAIGGQVARWLAGRGAPDLVLSSRSGPAASQVPTLAAALAASGTTVQVIACDSADREGLSGLLGRLSARGPRLSAVFHTAAATDDGVLDRLDPARLETALAAKAAGARHLDELTAGLDLDAFVLFSSVAGTIGGAGQGNYAAANAYLDALADSRRARGLAATAVAWGPWAGGGMAEASETVRARLRRGPMSPMDPELAIRLLGQAIDGRDSVLAVMDMDWARLAATPDAGDLREVALLRELPDVAVLAPPTAGRGRGELTERLAGLSAAAQQRLLTDLVRAEAAAVLGHASAALVEPRRAFSDLGFDSLTAVELRNRLEALTGLRLPATVVFDYPAASALAGFLRTGLTGAAGDAAADGGAAAAVTPAGGRSVGNSEPIAIVGIGCRFPGGAASPRELWELLAGGVDAISGFPPDRGWDDDVLDAGIGLGSVGQGEAGYARSGGFMADATGFDAGFFGISPREAAAMDPQQRLMLEVAWEALERAGIEPGSLRGSQTGVFTGGYGSGYEMSLVLGGDSDGPGPGGYLMTGNATSVISGRVSYALGLEGPAVTVDTACSSSLVALHLACQALRAGECGIALAGGVTVIATPGMFIEFSHQQGLAADGRCKPFSADADGIVWGEGAGALVLMRLSDARRAGHPVLALITGSAVNSDGASNGLTAPNGPSQQRVIRAALASAGVSPHEVDAVEAHGTGTALGDPIEAQALMATYGQDRPDGRPLWLGSVKSNLGHTGAAAGVAGVIKMVLALQQQELPPTLHASRPSPHVAWDDERVRLLTEPVPWPAAGAADASDANSRRPRRAGVSAFGISGTNAHVIIEEATVAAAGEPDTVPAGGPRVPWVLADDAGAVAWPVSGKTAAALSGQAGKLAAWAGERHDADQDVDPARVAWSLAVTRSAFEHRAVVIGSALGRPAGKEAGEESALRELTAGLAALAAGEPAARTVSGTVPPGGDPGRVVFVFPGQGSQWAGMGMELAAVSPVFAARLAECSQALARYTGWRLEDVLAGADGAPGLERVDVVQSALWAVMVSLAAVWRAAGVEPDAVAGHSQGEIAAAVVAGVLSLDDAAKVVALRSKALTVLAGRGGMASVAESAAAVAERLAGYDGRLAVAAVNGPNATVVSGDPDAINVLAAACEADGIRARVLPVDYASHGPQVEELREEILAALDGITPRRAVIPMISAMTGEYLAGPEADAGYWYASLRAPVEFQRSVEILAGAGHGVFLEASPQPVLTTAMTETLEELRAAGTVTGTLRRDDGGAGRLLASLAAAFTAGAGVDWAKVMPAADRVELPTYAFQHERYWGPSLRAMQEARSAGRGDEGAVTAAEARFWTAVEGGDLRELAETLAVDARRPFGEVLPALASWRRRERDDSATADWRYRVAWPLAADSGPGTLSGAWLLVAPSGKRFSELVRQCAQAMEAHGAALDTMLVDCAAISRDVLAGLIEGALAGEPLTGVVSLLALNETPVPGLPAVPGGLAATVGLIQGLGDAGIGAPLWVLTRGAVAAEPDERVTGPVQAQTWGLGRVAGLEHPDRWGGLIDLPPVLDERAAALLCAVLAAGAAGGGEDQLAIRPAGLLTRRMVRAAKAAATSAWAPRGSVLITGGTGAIGGHVARLAASRGAPRVVLASRSGPAAPGVPALAAELAAAGTAVAVTACDSADHAALTGLVSRLADAPFTGPPLTAGQPPLTSVFHAAGAPQGIAVDELTPAALAAVLAAKAAGAASLDALTAGLDLDAFVLFSSGAATWGSGLQAGYAAANAFLDGLAASRRGRGLAATSVAWGMWGGGGMSGAQGVAELSRRGLAVMEPRLAIAALAQALDGGESLLTVADIDWARFAPAFTVRRPSPLISGVPEARAALESDAADPVAGADSGLRGRLAGLPRAEQDRVLTDLVRAETAAVLGHAGPEAIDPVRAFKELGLDSLTALDLRNRLAAATGRKLPSTLVYDHPNPAALAEYLWGQEFQGDGAEDPLTAELDKFESLVSKLARDAEAREIAGTRLKRLLAKLADAASQEDGQSVARKIESASDDEILNFIHAELGR
jgi:acyl transferase domain-containing protein/acyl carrier protein